ncbi:hypothetical protein PPERSA_05710 [Pseudocohnilembus persalinus]|uniref:Uncharacterized protein n=1 Tax=Pseudocohnilembus persalinus TaxID=266149 RepID=A0A0V0QMS0_PSEPJ|nr:hypothetical protein PPERSA_05710 [Pseudocohnilembus persalinus]|eukprot:KRX03352.1 hypothetical protein PPERSA_05710 [Pseudocohnilembus persalinus]
MVSPFQNYKYKKILPTIKEEENKQKARQKLVKLKINKIIQDQHDYNLMRKNLSILEQLQQKGNNYQMENEEYIMNYNNEQHQENKTIAQLSLEKANLKGLKKTENQKYEFYTPRKENSKNKSALPSIQRKNERQQITSATAVKNQKIGKIEHNQNKNKNQMSGKDKIKQNSSNLQQNKTQLKSNIIEVEQKQIQTQQNDSVISSQYYEDDFEEIDLEL